MSFQPLDWHFWLSVGGRRYSYVDIHKNACSAFRPFIFFTSKFADRTKPEPYLEFAQKFHRESSLKDIRASDRRIAVLRDPIERVASVYCNKFVDRQSPRGLFVEYQEVTGEDPANASFADFIERYIAKLPSLENPHVRPQHLHLLDVTYDAVILMPEVKAAARTLFGDEMAQTFFSDRLNKSNAEHFIRGGIPEHLLAIVRSVYAEDFELLEKAKAQASADGLSKVTFPAATG